MELVQEIHQLLMDREDTCHRTCFSLQLDGNTLDNFAELKNIEGLKEGSVIKVVEEPYTMREARIHVRHVRDLLKSLDPADAYNGIECNSLSFLNTVTQGDILGELSFLHELFKTNFHIYISREKENATGECGLHSTRLYHARKQGPSFNRFAATVERSKSPTVCKSKY